MPRDAPPGEEHSQIFCMEISGHAVQTPEDVGREIETARGNKRENIVLLVARRGAEQFVAVKLPRIAS